MPKLKVLNSDQILSIFLSFGFEKFSQKGSHIKLVRQTSSRREILIIPNHKDIKKGTIKAIYTQACMFISSEKLNEYFYTE